MMRALRQLPNGITMVRLIGGPVLAYIFATGAGGNPTHFFDTIFFWFLGLVLTDWLDGFLARRMGAESRLGAILDPIADKALVWPFFGIFLFTVDVLDTWVSFPLILLALYDAYSTVRRFRYWNASEIPLRANWFGKVKTAMSYLAASCLLLVVAIISFLFEFEASVTTEAFMRAALTVTGLTWIAQIAIAGAAMSALFSLMQTGLRRIKAQN